MLLRRFSPSWGFRNICLRLTEFCNDLTLMFQISRRFTSSQQGLQLLCFLRDRLLNGFPLTGLQHWFPQYGVEVVFTWSTGSWNDFPLNQLMIWDLFYTDQFLEWSSPSQLMLWDIFPWPIGFWGCLDFVSTDEWTSSSLIAPCWNFPDAKYWFAIKIVHSKMIILMWYLCKFKTKLLK